MCCIERATHRRLAADTRGAAYVEFVLVFPILFFFFTSIVQLCLLYAASLMAEHAAERAARAASVVLDDDPTYYGGDARGDANGESATPRELAAYYTAGLGSQNGAPVATDHSTPSRRATVEIAAMIPLLALGRRPPGTLSAAAEYTVSHTRVLVRTSPDPGRDARDRGGDVEVTVSFDLPCALPLGGRFVCRGSTRTIAATARRAVHRAYYPYRGGPP